MSLQFPGIVVRADTGDADTRKRVVESALEAGVTTIILEEEDSHLAHLGYMMIIYRSGNALFFDGRQIGRIHTLHSAEALDAVDDTDDIAIIETPGWTVIPLENLISRLHHTKIYAQVSTPEEAQLACEILEKGCAGIAVTAPSSPLSDFLQHSKRSRIQLTRATIVRIEPVPLSDRVCVDTTSILAPSEGMLIGSSSSCFFQVCSENQQTEYADARPFRVNAGAIHSYVKLPGDTTGYLSELAAGSTVLTRSENGKTRDVTVGRVKIERRPMLLIEAELADHSKGSVVLQNAETVRIMTKNGPVSVADLQTGDTAMVLADRTGGRHFGIRIEETVQEL